MSKNIKPIVYMLAQKFMSKGLELRYSTDWEVFISFSSNSVDVAYFKDNDHWFRMEAWLEDENAEQNLRNFIHNIDRLEREYCE